MKFGAPTKVEDDEVVATYSVYLCPTLANETHVFQYPLRSQCRPYEENGVKLFCTEGSYCATKKGDNGNSSTTLKPFSRLTMLYSLDIFGSNSFRRQDLSTLRSEPQSEDKYTYSLYSKPFRQRSDYVVGYFIGNEFHLTPVSTIQQFTPALETPNTDGTFGVTSTGPISVANEHCSSQSAPVVPGLSASDRIQRELLRQRSAMLNSDASTAKELHFYSINSIESNAVKKRLLCQTKEANVAISTLLLSSAKVENSLYPPDILSSGGIVGGEEASTCSIIRRYASIYSVSDQVKQLMLRCQVLTLSTLSEIVVKPDSDGYESVPLSLLVDALRTCAVYMHGVWVSRCSEKFKGAVAALREVVLLQFFKSPNGRIRRSELNRLVVSSSSRRSIKEILMSIAELNNSLDPSQRFWALQYVPTDNQAYNDSVSSFRFAFASEEMAQRAAWEKRQALIMGHLPYITAGFPPPVLFLAGRCEATRPSASPTFVSPTGTHVASPTSSSDPVREQDLVPIQQYIRMLFAEHGVLNKLRAKEMVLKGKEMNFPRATNHMLSMALQSCVQPFTQSTWILKNLGEPSVDLHRQTILEVILDLKIFESRAVINRLDDLMVERGTFTKPADESEDVHAIPALAVQRVISEVAEYKKGERLWHLKTGNVMTE